MWSGIYIFFQEKHHSGLTVCSEYWLRLVLTQTKKIQNWVSGDSRSELICIPCRWALWILHETEEDEEWMSRWLRERWPTDREEDGDFFHLPNANFRAFERGERWRECELNNWLAFFLFISFFKCICFFPSSLSLSCFYSHKSLVVVEREKDKRFKIVKRKWTELLLLMQLP